VPPGVFIVPPTHGSAATPARSRRQPSKTKPLRKNQVTLVRAGAATGAWLLIAGLLPVLESGRQGQVNPDGFALFGRLAPGAGRPALLVRFFAVWHQYPG